MTALRASGSVGGRGFGFQQNLDHGPHGDQGQEVVGLDRHGALLGLEPGLRDPQGVVACGRDQDLLAVGLDPRADLPVGPLKHHGCIAQRTAAGAGDLDREQAVVGPGPLPGVDVQDLGLALGQVESG